MMTVETNPISSIDPQSCTLLIVDDEPANLALATGYLAGYGFQIKIAQTGEIGLEVARLAQPDLILLDVRLPGIDGFETCRALKADERTREIPIIFMTVAAKTEDKVKGFEVGGVDYITKPFQQEEVLARVTAHLRIQALTRKLENAKETLERQVAERTVELAQVNRELRDEIAEHKRTVEALRKSEARDRRLFERTQAALAETQALYRVTRSVSAFGNLPHVLQTVVDAVAQALPADRVTLVTFDLDTRQVTHFVKGGPGASQVVHVSFDELWNGLSGWVLREMKPALSPRGVPDPREAPEVQRRRAETNCGAIIVVPLRYRDKTLGTLTAINCPDERDFRQRDVKLMVSMADQAAIAIENARLYDAAQQEIAERKQAEEALRLSEEKYRALVENINDVIFSLDAQGFFTYISPAIERFAGYKTDQVVGQPFARFVHPADLATLQASFERTLTGNLEPYEFRVLAQDGAVLHVHTFSRPLWEGGQLVGLTGIMTDITERVRAEQERLAHLRFFESMDQINRAIQGANDLKQMMSDVLDLVLSILECDRAFLMYPCDPNAPTWSSPMERTKPEHPGVLELGLEMPMDADVAETLRLLLAADGPVKFGPGTPHPLPADVAEQFDFKCFMSMALYPKVGKPWQFGIHQCSYPRIWTPEEERLLQEIGRRLADGLTSLLSYQEVQQSEERLRELVRERTAELTIAKDAALEAQRAAEAANQAKSAFLANMSHELRTPLNAVLGFSQLMTRDPNLTPSQQTNLETIGRSGEHLLALINDVLELSRIEAGRAEVQAESFDLWYMLLGLEEMFRLRAETKGLTLVFERGRNVPQYVGTDANKLRQVLINLLGNAVKFTQEGGVTLRVKYGDGDRVSGRLSVEVEDSGPGIALQEMEAVFDPFVQTESGRKSLKGSGLGLSISRHFVRLMGGDIGVESEPGARTVFRFDVPVQLVAASGVQPVQPTRRVVGLEPGQRAADGTPYRLLVVEDVDSNRQLLVQLLQLLGFDVREAVNGQAAIDIWEQWKPHLIWMDMRMPVLDGYEATKRIRALGTGHSVLGSGASVLGSGASAPAPSPQPPAPSTQHPAPSTQHPAPSPQPPAPSTQHPAPSPQHPVIIALTASSFEEERAVVLHAGCDDYLRKPFREAELFDLMSKHLGVRFIYEEGAQGAGSKEQGAGSREQGAGSKEQGARNREQGAGSREQGAAQNVLTPERVAALPAEWLATLKQGAEEADIEMLREVIAQIRERDAALAAVLARLVEDFAYDEILATLQHTTKGGDAVEEQT